MRPEPEMLQPPQVVNRRAHKRYRSPPVVCQVLTTGPDGSADVVDLSACGTCLLLRKNAHLGAVLVLRLTNRAGLSCREVSLRLTHCRGQDRGPCLAGGPFVPPLSHDDLCALMSEA
jgi:hypothetical protein